MPLYKSWQGPFIQTTFSSCFDFSSLNIDCPTIDSPPKSPKLPPFFGSLNLSYKSANNVRAANELSRGWEYRWCKVTEHKRMTSHIGWICFPQCVFSNVSSNGLPERMHIHTGRICLMRVQMMQSDRASSERRKALATQEIIEQHWQLNILVYQLLCILIAIIFELSYWPKFASFFSLPSSYLSSQCWDRRMRYNATWREVSWQLISGPSKKKYIVADCSAFSGD